MFHPQVITVIKYGFLGLVVTGAGFLIANTAVPTYYKMEALEDISYKAQVSVWNDSSILGRNFMKCLTESSKPFCLIPKHKRLKLLRNPHHISHASKTEKKEMPKPIQPIQVNKLMFEFISLTNSLGVRPFLLEPSMLFCLLSAYQKNKVISSGLNTSILLGSPYEVTFGIFEKDSVILRDENSTRKYLESGYEFSTAQMPVENQTISDENDTCFFYSRNTSTIRVIVFYKRGNFLWHPGFSDFSQFESGPFVQACGFENFNPIPLQLENGTGTGFYMPSELNRFLLGIQGSKFEECPMTSKVSSSHPSLSLDQLYFRVSIVIQELKSTLRPLMGTFWIWSKTLSGWNEDCNLFGKTPELNVAFPAYILSKMNMNQSFVHNDYLQQLDNSQWEHRLILECHGLIINVYIIYEDSRSIWDYEKNTTGHWIKNSYPKFELCSIEVMELLIHKPCGKFLRR